MERYVEKSPAVVENIYKVLLEEELLDFTVIVDNVMFSCHRLVLIASSQFFRACLRSDMKEAKDGCVTLNGMSASTFETILKSIYTGRLLLSLDNLTDIWQAVEQLQIDFMIEECESFALYVLSEENIMLIWMLADRLQKPVVVEHCQNFAVGVLSLENFESIFETAKNLNSKKVVNACKRFMIYNFEGVCQMETTMGFSLDEFLNLIENQDLTISDEDLVLETVLNWIDYIPKELSSNVQVKVEEEHLEYYNLNTDTVRIVNTEINKAVAKLDKETHEENIDVENRNRNDEKFELSDISTDEKCTIFTTQKETSKSERVKALTTLLKSVRTGLVSTPLLKHCLKHRLIVDNAEAKNIIIKAVLCKTTHHRHGQWPTAAIHRPCSELVHCGIACIDGTFLILTAREGTSLQGVKNDALCLNVTLVVFDSYLYATGIKNSHQSVSSLYVLCGKSWKKITKIPGRHLILVPYEQYIFILDRYSTLLYRILPKDRNPRIKEFTKLPKTIRVQQAINYQRTILIFSSVTVNGEEKTAVHQLDILTKELKELEQLNGPAEQIISFSDDNNTYLLQTNGNVWIIECLAGNITFRSIGKLWSTHRKLYGAFTYKQKLIIFGSANGPVEENLANRLKVYVSEIKYWGTDNPSSNFIPFIVSKNELLPLN